MQEQKFLRSSNNARSKKTTRPNDRRKAMVMKKVYYAETLPYLKELPEGVKEAYQILIIQQFADNQITLESDLNDFEKKTLNDYLAFPIDKRNDYLETLQAKKREHQLKLR